MCHKSVHSFSVSSIAYLYACFFFVSVCFNLASTFTKHIGTYITWHDIQHNVATVEDCEQQCRQHGDNCLSFDYQPSDSKCRLNSISRQDASDSGYLLSETGKNLYTKDCDDSLIV